VDAFKPCERNSGVKIMALSLASTGWGSGLLPSDFSNLPVKISQQTQDKIEIFTLDKLISKQLPVIAQIQKLWRAISTELPAFDVDTSRLISLVESLRSNEKWRAFVVSLAKPPWTFTGEHVAAVTTLWEDLNTRFSYTLPLPLTQPTNDGNIQLAWDQGRHYVEIDVCPDGQLEWFYRDRETNELDGTEDDPESAVSEALLRRLRLTISQ
jgi:hypothetical protein